MRVRLALAIGIALWCAPTGAQSKNSFDAILSAYDAGDHDVVANTLRTPADFRTFMSQLDGALQSRVKAGIVQGIQDPVRAIFWMEIAAAATVLSAGGDVVRILSLGRTPARMGSGDRPEAFERLWHQTALALLQRIKRPDLQKTYLDSLELRYFMKLNTVAATRPVGRFVLGRAVAAEQTCWLAQFPTKREVRNGILMTVFVATPRLTAVKSPKDAAGLPATCRAAGALFDRAATFPDVAAEADLRAAVARFKLGQHDAALSALQRVRADGTDPVRDYWAALVEARILQQIQRLPEAERAYRKAWAIWPEARSPGTGLALVLFDMNRREEAIAASESVYALPVSGVDPWWIYATADARFVRHWRDALQELAK